MVLTAFVALAAMNNFPSLLVSAAFLSAPLVLAIPAVLVLLSGKRKLHSWFWFAFCLCAAGFSIANHSVACVVTDLDLALIVARFGFSAAAAGCGSYLAFGLSFPELRPNYWKGLVATALATLLFIIGFLATPLLVARVDSYGLGLNMPVAGPLLPAYSLFVGSSFLIPTVLFVRRYRRSVGRERLQLGYVLVTTGIMLVAAVGSLAPTVSRESLFSLFPMLVLVAAPSLITYAIIRHQLWDIRTVAHKTALWLIASSLLGIPIYLLLRYGGGVLARSPTVLTPLAVIAIFGTAVIHFRFFQPWLDRRFLRGTNDPIHILDSFNHEVLNLRGANALARLLEDTFRTTVYASSVRVSVPEESAGLLRTLGASGHEEPAPWTMELSAALVHVDQVLDVAFLGDYQLDPEVSKEFELRFQKHKTSVCLPLLREGRLIGLVELGEKLNLRAYTRNDFRLLEQIRPAATVALANAQLYDRLHELTLSLENRVKQRTHELEEANAQLRQHDRQKNDFFANITHELRTPLTLILAPLEDLLLQCEERGEDTADLRAMHINALRLLQLINGLLELARMDAGKLRIKAEPVGLNKLAESIVDNFQAVARRKEVSLTFGSLEGDDSVVCDGLKMEVVLGNLVANAVKFTPAGGAISVRVSGDRETVSVTVEDTGIGIPEDQRERIFDRFAQVEGGTTRPYEGAGIGLSLVKEIVEAHGGFVSVTGAEGKGSVFTITLDRSGDHIPEHLRDRRTVDLPTDLARRAEDHDPMPGYSYQKDGDVWVSVEGSPSEPPPPSTPNKGARILVVEDNIEMRAYLARRLQRNYQVEVCANGREAMESVTARPPDLVIADVMMPEVSGYELCRWLKKQPSTSSIPVLLLTARKGVDRTLEGFRAGADDYLTKPFNFRELLARIQVQLKLVEMGRKLAAHEKREALNLVAAGLAHEVRNPVNAILNAVRPLLEENLTGSASPDSQEAARELLTAIEQSASRIDRLVGDILGVSRNVAEEATPWIVSDALDSTVRLLRYKHGTGTAVHTTLQAREAVLGNVGQLNQVLMNLVDNALRAAGPTGEVRISTQTEKGLFRLLVGDNGPGIPRGLEDRIFDPLFTTHESQDATGLGLHIARRIVEEHKGRVYARPSAGNGALFVVELPLPSANGAAPV